MEGKDKPGACEEHTCPWNFAEGGRDLGLEKREWSPNSFRQESDGVIRRVGSRRSRDIGCSNSFRAERRQKGITMSAAEVKFASKGSWIDLHTDSGVQRVPVRVKVKTFGLTIRKTDAWIIPEISDPAPRAVVAPAEEETGRAEQTNPAPAAQEAEAAPRPEETQGVRLEQEATTLQHPGRARDSWDNRSAKEDSRAAATLKT